MFKFTAIILALATVQNVNAWSMPKLDLEKAAATAAVSAALVAGPMAVNAADFSGSYSDPNHPNCLREVQVLTKNKAEVKGTDGNPGCPPDGRGRTWALIGQVDGDSILIDFSPKGGPKDLKGVWEASPTPGIRFPDGNLWSKKD
mmetsp:Transcript_28401/g.81652  ORF Transcript_28401/g.81652 Transcript_28401/m.81652 type:complete len:145 (-) Transcript_28401:58-492(-)